MIYLLHIILNTFEIIRNTLDFVLQLYINIANNKMINNKRYYSPIPGTVGQSVNTMAY